MYKQLNSLLPLALFFGITVFLFLGLKLEPSNIPSPLIDKPAPTFQLPQLTDLNKTLSTNDFTGRAVLFNIWASWCASCRYEHPILMQLAHEIPIYSLNYKDDRETALAWLKHYGNPYVATAFDAEGRVGIDWGVYGTPETFLIDQNGIIRYKHTGPVSQMDVETILRPWIKKMNIPPIKK